MGKEAKKLKRVGVLRGGEGKHYTSSLKTGGEIITLIFENLGEKYKVLDILVDKDGKWHLSGFPILPADLVNKVDVIWNTSHPSFSNILDSFSIPNISVGSFSFALQNKQDALREYLKNVGIQMPRAIISPKNAKEVHEKISPPWIVKFSNEIKVIKTFNELAEAISDKKDLIVEEFITGKIATVHAVANFRGEDIYTFPLGNSFGTLLTEEKEKIINVAKNLYKHLGIKHYLKSDFIVTPRGKIYLLQINGAPNFKKGSHLSEVCESVGAKMHHVIEHLLEQV